MSKKIIFFLSNLNGGGAQRTIVNILKHIDRSKFSCKLALLEYDKKQAYSTNIPEDIPIININRRARNAIFKLVNVFREKKPDISFSTLPQVNAVVSIAHSLSKSKSKLILRETNYRKIGENQSRIDYLITRYAYKRCNQIIALSKGVAKDIENNYGIDQKCINIIYNPIDLVSIKNDASEPMDLIKNKFKFNIVVCGRFVKQKNFSMLLYSLAKMKIDKGKWEVWVLGEGPEEDKLKQLALELDLIENVKFLGFKKNPYNYMKNADLFVLSSLWEGFGHVIVEAMACGTPVLATDCPYGPREILENGKFGWLVPNNDIGAMANQIEYLLSYNDEVVNMRGIINERVEMFESKRIVKKYESVLD